MSGKIREQEEEVAERIIIKEDSMKEAMEFLNYVAETSKGWDEPNPREV